MLVLDWEEAILVSLQSTINIILLLLELKELSDKGVDSIVVQWCLKVMLDADAHSMSACFYLCLYLRVTDLSQKHAAAILLEKQHFL